MPNVCYGTVGRRWLSLLGRCNRAVLTPTRLLPIGARLTPMLGAPVPARHFPPHCAGRRISRETAGTTDIDSSGAVTMPPTIGAAIRCITSEPVPT